MTLTAAFVTNRTVPFQRVRHLLERQNLQEGAWAAGDLKVTQRGAGANMSVDTAAGDAWVEVDTGTRNGLAPINSDAVENKAVGAAHATLPRLDQVVLRYNDSSLPSGAGDTPTIEVIAGTPTSGATLDNRNGNTPLPNDCLRLADVLVPAASSSVTNANIRDRRPWARGAFRRIRRVSNAGAGNDYTTASASFASIDATNLRPRLECSGVPLRISLMARLSHGGVGQHTIAVPWADGAIVEGSSGDWFAFLRDTNSSDHTVRWAYEFTPAAGSHRLEWAWRTTAASASAFARADFPLLLTIEELVRQDATND